MFKRGVFIHLQAPLPLEMYNGIGLSTARGSGNRLLTRHQRLRAAQSLDAQSQIDRRKVQLRRHRCPGAARAQSGDPAAREETPRRDRVSGAQRQTRGRQCGRGRY